MVTTGTIAKETGLTRQAILSRARRLGIPIPLDKGNPCLWTPQQAAKLKRTPKAGRPKRKESR